MQFVPLALLAVAVVGLGSAATVLLTRWIPQPVAQLAAQHGRFIGLGEQDGGMAAAVPYPYACSTRGDECRQNFKLKQWPHP
jgi:hypothetical protein